MGGDVGKVANTGNTQQMGKEEQRGVCVVADVKGVMVSTANKR